MFVVATGTDLAAWSRANAAAACLSLTCVVEELDSGSNADKKRPFIQLDISKYIVEFSMGKACPLRKGRTCPMAGRIALPTNDLPSWISTIYVYPMPNDVVHDVLYAVHCKRGIPADALTSELEKLCRKIRVQLRWGLLGSFLAICVVAAYGLWSGSPMQHWWTVVKFLLGLLVAGAVLYLVADALPLIRDFSRFDTYAYQARQLEAAHDLAQAADLEHFGLTALALTDKWLSLRIDRLKLRLGIHVGGSDKMAILAVIAGAWTLWHNFPQDGAAYERYLYLWLAAFLGGSGIAALYVNAVLARMSYQRDLLSIAIHRLSNR